MKLEGRTALITGAGRGMGDTIARHLAAQGAVVAVADIDVVAAHGVAASIGGRSIAVSMDVRSWESVRSATVQVEAALGPVDALVNNAGISRVARSEELPPEWWDEVIDVNLSGTWRCAQVIGSRMVERGRGAIVNIGSAYSEIGAPGRVAYAASKTGVIGMTRVLGTEWASRGCACQRRRTRIHRYANDAGDPPGRDSDTGRPRRPDSLPLVLVERRRSPRRWPSSSPTRPATSPLPRSASTAVTSRTGESRRRRPCPHPSKRPDHEHRSRAAERAGGTQGTTAMARPKEACWHYLGLRSDLRHDAIRWRRQLAASRTSSSVGPGGRYRW